MHSPLNRHKKTI